MQRYFDRGMLAVLAALLAVTVANGLLAYKNIRGLDDSRLRVDRSRQVQLALQQVVSLAREAESGVRGFVLTGESSWLQPYDSALAATPAQLDNLSGLVSEARPHELAELRSRLDAHLVELAAILAVRREAGFDSAREAMRAGHDKARMVELQSVAARMRAAEGVALDAHLQASAHALDMARAASAFVAMLAILILGGLVWQMRRNLVARDRAAAILGAQKELFRTTLAGLGEAVVTCDTGGHVTFLNGAAEALTGWSAVRAAGQPIDDIVRVVDVRSHRPIVNSAERVLQDGLPVPIGHRGALITRGGGERPVDDSAAPILDADGRIVGAVLVVRDITERRRSEDALRDADRRKDEFLAVLAHELRNPLSPLRNALQIVRLSGHSRAAVEQVFGMMERQVQQMVRLIDDLLDVSRITRNKLELRREAVDMAEVIEAALEMSAPVVARYGHRVEVEIERGLPLVDGDRARLVQVVDNLVTNAAKYSEAGGAIAVRANMRPDGLHVTVKDNGVGIPPDMLEKIFEMFTQVDRTLERSRGGLGIGLTLVRRLVQLHGGSIVARSEGGHGSEFELVLPALASQPASRAAPGAAVEEIVPGLRVLVADDNADAADSLAAMLRMMGHDVSIAHDGEECIAVFGRARPDVALLDIGMPRKDGYEVAREIRSRWGGHALLIAVTGWGQEEDRRRAHEAGFDHHLAKPADFTRLARLLHAARRTEAHA